jgi:hypothetical protein
MDVRISVSAAGGGEAAPEALRGLESWLRDEPELRGRVKAVRGAPQPGEMSGGLVEALAVTLGSGVSAALVRSLPIWLKQQRSRVEIQVKNGNGDTVRVKADNVRSGDAEELIRKALGEGEPPT